MHLVVSDSTTPIAFLHHTSLTLHSGTFKSTACDTRYITLTRAPFLSEYYPTDSLLSDARFCDKSLSCNASKQQLITVLSDFSSRKTQHGASGL